MKEYFEVCFVGTPDGFECVSRSSPLDYKIQRILDLHTPRFGLAEFEILRVSQKLIDGELYKIVAIYSNAFEIKLQRGGGFIGTAFLYKNCFQQNVDLLMSTLEGLHVNFKHVALKQNSKFSRSIQSAVAEIVVPSFHSFSLVEVSKSFSTFPGFKRDLVINVSSGSRLANFTDCIELIVEDNLLNKVPSIYALKDSSLAVESLSKTQDFVSLRDLKLSSQRDLETLYEQLDSLSDNSRRLEAENKILKTRLLELELEVGVRGNQFVKDKTHDFIGGLNADRVKAANFEGSLQEDKNNGGVNLRDLPQEKKRVVINSAVGVEKKIPSKRADVVNGQDDGLWSYIAFGIFVVLIIIAVVYVVIYFAEIQKLFEGPPARASVQSDFAKKSQVLDLPIESREDKSVVCALTDSDKSKLLFNNRKYKDVDEVVAAGIDNCPPNQGCTSKLSKEFMKINGLTSGLLEIGKNYEFISSKKCEFPPTVFPPAKAAGKR